MRNPEIPKLAEYLRGQTGSEVFDDWYSPGPETDDYWQTYEKARARTFAQALDTPHAWNVFRFDKLNLDKARDVVLAMPAGKSAHIELGYSVGMGKRSFIFMDGEPERFDVMYRFATKVCTSREALVSALSS